MSQAQIQIYRDSVCKSHRDIVKKICCKSVIRAHTCACGEVLLFSRTVWNLFGSNSCSLVPKVMFFFVAFGLSYLDHFRGESSLHWQKGSSSG